MSDSSDGDSLAVDTFEEVRPLLLRSMFWRPAYISRSAWLDHIPFAFWLIEAHRPTTLVELGTQFGASYFAFCQAVDRLGLDAKCYAVDTWKGDEHAGFYGEEVFAGVNGHNEARYSGFSRLVRSTFDDALGYFSDGTIDLLHIDGLHTLEAVAHDFESWLPKLTDDAVVLFHDTNVRERGFGVFQCFEELRKTYPSFEFVHGHGLGVLGVGKEQKPLLSWLFEANDKPVLRRSIREIFSRLGSSCNQALLLQKGAEQQKRSEAKLAEAQGALTAVKSAAAARDTEVAAQIAKLDGERTRLFSSLEALGRSREQETAAYEARLAQLELELGDRSQQVYSLTQRRSDQSIGRNDGIAAVELKQLEQTHDQEISAYEAKVRELERDLAERSREVETLTQRLEDATAEAEAAEAALLRAAEAETLAQQLTGEVERLKANVSDRFRELGEVGHLLQAKTAETQKLAELEAAVDERVAQAESQLALEKSEVAKLGANVADRFQELATMSRLLKDRSAEVEKLSRSEAAALARSKEAEALADRRKSEIERLEANVAARFREIATLSRLLKDQGRAECEQMPGISEQGRRAPILGGLTEVNGRSISERLAFVSGGAQEAAARLRQALEPIGGLRWRIVRQRRLVKASGLFDAPWYQAQNPDVAAAGADPLDHFLLFGGQEGRSPSRAFDSAAYLRENLDVAKSGLNPLVHYLASGRAEGRRASPLR
ncbi:class I SAM-dependent methyltransferase [Hyphomicrobium sp. CS1GBMeth3]|uniref:class I SAM-dependent methyltransferase n=1 Tax=Hyphomicrobium sp. CS1GBMeth3 TaxID=1892845 RepID=UPI000AA42AA5|nr:class I SAM-dependent methyltransferase [Hyphomicrobium sp. CS1GBMeth3]